MTAPTPTDEILPPVVTSSRRALLQRVLEVVISVAFLYFALRGIQFGVLWTHLRTANYLWLVPAVAATVAALAIKAWRWQLLFHPEQHLRFSAVFTALTAGYLVSNVLPARLGEVVSIVLLASDEPVSIARTLSNVIVTRLLDLLTLLAILVGLLPFVRLPAEMTDAARVLGVAALLGSALIVVLSFWKARVLSLAHAVFRHVRPLDRQEVYAAVEHLIDGFATLRSRQGIVLVGVSFLAWGVIVLVAWACAQAFHLDVPLTAVLFAQIVVALGMLIPSSPGYIGIYHYLTTVALAPFGVAKDQALGYAIIWHATNYLTLSITGMVALWIHGTSLESVRRAILARWDFRRRGAGAASRK